MSKWKRGRGVWWYWEGTPESEMTEAYPFCFVSAEIPHWKCRTYRKHSQSHCLAGTRHMAETTEEEKEKQRFCIHRRRPKKTGQSQFTWSRFNNFLHKHLRRRLVMKNFFSFPKIMNPRNHIYVLKMSKIYLFNYWESLDKFRRNIITYIFTDYFNYLSHYLYDVYCIGFIKDTWQFIFNILIFEHLTRHVIKSLAYKQPHLLQIHVQGSQSNE